MTDKEELAVEVRQAFDSAREYIKIPKWGVAFHETI